jgi:hypothetical protein
MKLNDVVEIIKRRIFFIRSLTNDFEEEQYIPPTTKCTEWILVKGPAYGIEGMIGTVLINTRAIHPWAKNHHERTWSSVLANRQALEHLIDWTANISEDRSVVTLIDKHQREVLVPHCSKFMKKPEDFLMWCPECGSYHSEYKDSTEQLSKQGSRSNWIERWHCPNDHLIFEKYREIVYL